jgi:hypothetical protein
VAVAAVDADADVIEMMEYERTEQDDGRWETLAEGRCAGDRVYSPEYGVGECLAGNEFEQLLSVAISPAGGEDDHITCEFVTNHTHVDLRRQTSGIICDLLDEFTV